MAKVHQIYLNFILVGQNGQGHTHIVPFFSVYNLKSTRFNTISMRVTCNLGRKNQTLYFPQLRFSDSLTEVSKYVVVKI